MQKKYLSLEYLDAAQEYREMRKELNIIQKKNKDSRTETEKARIEELKKEMGENAKQQERQQRLDTQNHPVAQGTGQTAGL